MKRWIIILLIATIVGALVYFIFFYGKTPSSSTNTNPSTIPGTVPAPVNIDIKNPPAPVVGKGTPGITVDGDFGPLTDKALMKAYNINTINYQTFMYYYNNLAIANGLITVYANYNTNDKIIYDCYDKTTSRFIKNPGPLIKASNFPLQKGSKGVEVILLQILLKGIK